MLKGFRRWALVPRADMLRAAGAPVYRCGREAGCALMTRVHVVQGDNLRVYLSGFPGRRKCGAGTWSIATTDRIEAPLSVDVHSGESDLRSGCVASIA